MKKILIAAIIIPVVFLVLYFATDQVEEDINSFAECVEAGYPVMESDPEQCRVADGRVFVRESEEGEFVTLEGEFVCLPYRDETGPTTMECAFGLKIEDDLYYSLSMEGGISDISTGSWIKVIGYLTQKESDRYLSSGLLQVEELKEIN